MNMFDDLADPLGPPDGDALGAVLAKAHRRRVVRRAAGIAAVAGVLAIGGIAAVAAASSPTSTHVAVAAPSTTLPANEPKPTTTTSSSTSTTSSTTSSTSTSTTSTTTSTSTTTVPPTTTTTTFPAPTKYSAHLHADLLATRGGVSGGHLDMWEIQPHTWTVATTIEGASHNHYTVGVTTQNGASVFLNTICDVTGQGTIGCSATMNLDRYLAGGTPINVSVGAYDPASNGYSTVLQGDLH
jgi:hypothetical protein